MQSESVHTHIYLILATVQKRQKGMFPSVSFSVCPVMFRWEVTVCVSFKWEKKKNNKRSQPHWSCRNVQKAIPYNPRPWRVVKPNGIGSGGCEYEESYYHKTLCVRIRIPTQDDRNNLRLDTFPSCLFFPSFEGHLSITQIWKSQCMLPNVVA